MKFWVEVALAKAVEERSFPDPFGKGLVFTIRERESFRHRRWLKAQFLRAIPSARVAAVRSLEDSDEIEMLLLVPEEEPEPSEELVEVPFEVAFELARCTLENPDVTTETLASVVPETEEALALVEDCRSSADGRQLSREEIEQLLASGEVLQAGCYGEGNPAGQVLAEWILAMAA